ncbi:MAG: hypothetical protein Q7T72_13350 [Bacteroidales bacterium]|nr:hypothetical protein [Bacteroidales bacterium]
MKKLALLLLVTVFTVTGLIAQKTITIFNTTVKTKNVMGTYKLFAQKYVFTLKDVLVANEDYYFKTIGSYRNEFTSLEPNSFLNLVDKGLYPLLDEINMKYYDEVVIPKLKTEPDIKKRIDFIEFCKAWEKLTNYNQRKALLFQDEFIEIGNIIQSRRFTIINASFALKKKVNKKLSTTIKADIIANLKANNIDANASLVTYLSNTVNSQTEYSANMMVIEFEYDYMTRLKNGLDNISLDKIGTDGFSIGLKDYASPESTRWATTGLVVLKVDGTFNKSRLTEAGLTSDLAAKFKSLNTTEIANIAASISIGFVSRVEETFSAQIKNIYIKSFLTSEKIDDIDIALDKIQPLLK